MLLAFEVLSGTCVGVEKFTAVVIVLNARTFTQKPCHPKAISEMNVFITERTLAEVCRTDFSII
jgi:hypothetical protein